MGMPHACIIEEIFLVLDSTACRYLKLADKQKSQTRSCPEFQCQVAQNSSVRLQVLPVEVE